MAFEEERHYGVDTAEHLWLAFRSFGVRDCAAKLYCWMLSKASKWGQFDNWGVLAIGEYAEENNLNLDWTWFVSMTYSQAAIECFGRSTNKVMVKRALKELTDMGLIKQVKRGTRGHASIYLWASLTARNDEDFANPDTSLLVGLRHFPKKKRRELAMEGD